MEIYDKWPGFICVYCGFYVPMKPIHVNKGKMAIEQEERTCDSCLNIIHNTRHVLIEKTFKTHRVNKHRWKILGIIDKNMAMVNVS